MAHPLPEILTEASWNSNKGTIAKMAGETGIGAQMKKVATAYGKINWDKFDAAEIAKTVHSPDEVDEAVEAATKHYSATVEPLRTELLKLSALAKTTADKFAKNKIIPKKSTQHTLEISTEASQFATGLKSMDKEMNAILKLKDNLKSLDIDALLPNDFWPTVEKVSWFKDGDVIKFATNTAFTHNIATQEPDPQLVEVQKVAKQRVAAAIKAFKELKSAKGKTLKKGEIKKKLIDPAHDLCDNFNVMGPPGAGALGGLRGLLGYWMSIQSDLTKDKQKFSAAETTKAVNSLGAAMMNEENFMNKLEEAIDGFSLTLR